MQHSREKKRIYKQLKKYDWIVLEGLRCFVWLASQWSSEGIMDDYSVEITALV